MQEKGNKGENAFLKKRKVCGENNKTSENLRRAFQMF